MSDTKPRNIRMTDQEWADLEAYAAIERKRTGQNWTRADIIRAAIELYAQKIEATGETFTLSSH